MIEYGFVDFVFVMQVSLVVSTGVSHCRWEGIACWLESGSRGSLVVWRLLDVSGVSVVKCKVRVSESGE